MKRYIAIVGFAGLVAGLAVAGVQASGVTPAQLQREGAPPVPATPRPSEDYVPAPAIGKQPPIRARRPTRRGLVGLWANAGTFAFDRSDLANPYARGTAAPARASSWCGARSSTDRTPNLVAGYPVRVVYAIPSEGEDRFVEVASTIQRDVETIDSWWRAQDQTRTVRFDLAPSSCGPQLDLRSIRLGGSGAALADPGFRWRTIAEELSSLDSASGYGKFLVYYDGPVSDPGMCGEAGNPDDGPGFALVLLHACRPIVPTATVAAHELLHALGAVAPRAPHHCRLPIHAHTCDSEDDVMFPYADGSMLEALVLDAGRDDYYGHPGSWYDVRASDWLVRLDRQVALSLTIAGSGSVESDVPGLACSATCTTRWNAGARVVLAPRPAAGMRFVGWRGACPGASSCRLALGRAASVSALFAAKTRRRRAHARAEGRTPGVAGSFRTATRSSPE